MLVGMSPLFRFFFIDQIQIWTKETINPMKRTRVSAQTRNATATDTIWFLATPSSYLSGRLRFQRLIRQSEYETLRVVQYSQIDSIGVSGDSNHGSIGKSKRFLCGWLIERGMSIIIIIIKAFLLGVKANLFCTNRAIGMKSFSFGTNPAIGTNGPSV